MKRRPWPVVILALLQLLAPIVGLIITSALENTSPIVFTRTFIESKSWLEIIDFFALLPLAGVAIYLMKKWSYPIFLVVMGWTIYENTRIWFTYYQNSLSIWIFVGIMALNVLAVTYYLLPAVREIYFNDRIRWWESKPRFMVEIPGIFEHNQLSHPCTIRDLSVGGSFIESNESAKVGDEVCLQVSVLNKRFPIHGIVVHQRAGEKIGCGIQFDKKNAEDLMVLKNLVKALDLLGCDMTAYKESTWDSFSSWLKGLKSGKGLVPDIPNKKS